MNKKFDWKKVNIVKVCMYYGLADNIDSEWVLCPEHENDGREHSPSCKVYHNTDKDVIICFGGCYQKNGKRLCLDNISLVATLEGLDQEDKEECIEILKILEEVDNWNETSINKASVKIRESSKVVSSHSSPKSNLDMYKLLYDCSKSIHQLHTENKFFIDDYLNQRGINYNKCKEALEKNNLELRHNYYKNENSLILFDKVHNFAIKRKIDDYINGKVYDKKDYKYMNINPVHYSKIDGNKDNIIVFESFYDLLALYSHLKNPEDFTFISANSVSNISLIINEERNLLRDAKNIFLLVDNDDGGDGAVNKFRFFVPKSKDIRYKMDNNKDVCEYIKNNLYIRIDSEVILND